MLFSPSIKVESFLSTVTIAFKCTAVIYDYVVNLAGLTSLFACSWSSRGQTCTGLRVSGSDPVLTLVLGQCTLPGLSNQSVKANGYKTLCQT